jgi:predicted transposase/invertase (TIGR01784 family)
MSQFIDPLTDFGFKRIFANENHKDITISFINSILQLESPVIQIEFKNLEKAGDTKEMKKSVLDIFCKDTNKREFIVELQRAEQTYFIDRSIFYISKTVTDMGVVGDWNYEIMPVYFIGILSFRLSEQISNNYHHKFTLTEKNSGFEYKKMEIHFIELPKFKKSLQETDESEEWFYFLRNLLKTKREDFKKEKFTDALEIAKYSNLEGKERAEYEADLKETRDRYSIEQTQILNLERAEKSGRNAEKCEIARGMLADGVPLETISKYTGLSREDIEGL